MKEQSIELDCPPGYPRPDDLIEAVTDGLDLTIEEPTMKLFGCWKWMFPTVSQDRWLSIQPTLKDRITRLHNAGTIRYGSW